MVSSFLDLNFRELLKSFLIAFIGALVLALKAIFMPGGTIPATWVEWSGILYSSVGAGVLYIIATYFSGPSAANTEKQKVPQGR